MSQPWDSDVYDSTVFRNRTSKERRVVARAITPALVNGKFSPFTVYRSGPKHFKITPGTHNGNILARNGVLLTTENEFQRGVDFEDHWMVVDVWIVYATNPPHILLDNGDNPPFVDSVRLATVDFNDSISDGDGYVFRQISVAPHIKIGNTRDYEFEWNFDGVGPPITVNYRSYDQDQNPPDISE